MTVFWSKTAQAEPDWIEQLSEIIKDYRTLAHLRDDAVGRSGLRVEVFASHPSIVGAFPRSFSWVVFSVARSGQPEPLGPKRLAELLAEAGSFETDSGPITVVVSEAELRDHALHECVSRSEQQVELKGLAAVLGDLFRTPQNFDRLVVSPLCLEAVHAVGASLVGGEGFVGALGRARSGWSLQAPERFGGQAGLHEHGPAGFLLALATVLKWEGDDTCADRVRQAWQRSLDAVYRSADLGEPAPQPDADAFLQALRALGRDIAAESQSLEGASADKESQAA